MFVDGRAHMGNFYEGLLELLSATNGRVRKTGGSSPTRQRICMMMMLLLV